MQVNNFRGGFWRAFGEQVAHHLTTWHTKELRIDVRAIVGRNAPQLSKKLFDL